MPKFKMKEPKEGFKAFGYLFVDGVADIPETDKNAVFKLRGNSHFEEVKELTREEITEALKGKGIAYHGRQSTAGLLRLLNESS